MSNTAEAGDEKRKVSESGSELDEPELNFEPVITLPEVEISTNEENEEELIKLRAKLFRFDTTDPKLPEWKERGTGEVKLLRHRESHSVRVVMRRDRTLKVCANHFITPWMQLQPCRGSARAWLWTAPADFADETVKTECLAIRFATPEIANQWKDKFEEAKKIIKENCILYNNELASKLDTSSSSEDESDDNTIEDKKDSEEVKNKKKSEDTKLINNMAELNVSK